MLLVEGRDVLTMNFVEDPAMAARDGRPCRKWRLQFARLEGAQIRLFDVGAVPRVQSIVRDAADGSGTQRTIVKLEVGEVRVLAGESIQFLLDEVRVLGGVA
jgi:hypothetical protein